LAALYSHVLAAEREQNDIDQSLDHIEQQQKDLSATLDAYEKSTEEILGGQGGSLRALDTGPADNERDKKYAVSFQSSFLRAVNTYYNIIATCLRLSCTLIWTICRAP
jgi:hypothetical protein